MQLFAKVPSLLLNNTCYQVLASSSLWWPQLTHIVDISWSPGVLDTDLPEARCMEDILKTVRYLQHIVSSSLGKLTWKFSTLFRNIVSYLSPNPNIICMTLYFLCWLWNSIKCEPYHNYRQVEINLWGLQSQVFIVWFL